MKKSEKLRLLLRAQGYTFNFSENSSIVAYKYEFGSGEVHTHIGACWEGNASVEIHYSLDNQEHLIKAYTLRNLLKINNVSYSENMPAHKAVKEFLKNSGLQKILDEENKT